jgi:hypothetical protein
MPTYLNRAAQREYLKTQHGVELGKSALENMAYDDTGPKYVLIAGRALSTREWLDDWVQVQAARPVRRRRQRATTNGATASAATV